MVYQQPNADEIYSTHRRRMSVLGVRSRKAGRLAWRALTLKRRSTLKNSTIGLHIGYKYQGGGYSIGTRKAGHGGVKRWFSLWMACSRPCWTLAQTTRLGSHCSTPSSNQCYRPTL